MVTMAQSGWPPNEPDSLQDVCLDFCARHLFVLADMNSFDVKLRPGISLPRVLCEGLIRAYSRCGKHLSDEFLKLFEDPTRTQLRYIQLADYTVTEEGLKLLCKHPIVELDVSDSCAWTANSVKTLSKLGKTLSVLKLGSVVVDKALNGIEEFEIRGYNSKAGEQEFEASPDMRFSSAFTTPVLGEGDMCSSAPDDCFERMRIYGRDYIFDCPNLRVLSLKNCNFGDHGHDLLATVLSPLERLTHLDLTKCQNVQLEYLNCFKNCHNLLSLVLADIDITELWFVVKDIAKIKSLRHLDLSQSFEVATMYPDAEGCVKHLATHLPALISLDLSGTNLAGFVDEPEVEHRLQAKTEEIRIAESAPKCPIPGLEGKQLEFLGLLGCPHNACQRKNIPAAKVTGDDSEDQVLLSVEVYQDRTELLTKAFNNLFHLFRTSVVRQQYRAVEGILIGMKKHKADKHVQISGSASLFYIVKGEEKDHINYKLKRRIIEALLDGMSRHIYEQTMMRNGCLTLCHFSIPQEVLFCYDRLVRVLLRMLKQDLEEQDQFVTRIGIYLLNCLACQVDGREKQLVGDLGAIGTMLSIIRRKLTLAQCDEIMEVAWSTMWNVTDETAMNCQRFMEEDGMQLFLQCLRVFPNKAELLRNMMGLMGNVAEVAYLRPSLMKADYINVFSELLDSESDGIEVSYNAAGVLAHMCSDGEGAWPADLPPRPSVLARLTQAIQRWDISSSRNINYRSFEPILRLACSFETPESQHWAVWALCNLTKVYPEKYCELLEKEKGLDVLHKIINHRNPYKVIKDLARTVIHTHRKTMQKSAKGNNSDQGEGTQEEETDEQCMSDLDEAADEELHQDV